MVYNPYIVVPLATWAVAQVAKFAIAAIKGRIDFRYLYASGGMPSVHSAVMSSLAVTAFLVDGAASHLFGFVLIMALVVMYDSLGVRRAAGEQAVVLNTLIDNLERNRFKLDAPPARLREVLGHKPKEVLVGAVTGVVLGALFNYDKLGALGDYLQTVPPKFELHAYVAIFALLILGGFIVRFILSRRYKKSKVMKQFKNRLFVAAETIGWVGLILAVFIYERASYLSWRLWPLVLLGIGLAWAYAIATGSARGLSSGLAQEAELNRKQKWMTPNKRSR